MAQEPLSNRFERQWKALERFKKATVLPETKVLSAPPGVCSVPLIEVTPPSENGTMRVIQPTDSDPGMPKVQGPAPSCAEKESKTRK